MTAILSNCVNWNEDNQDQWRHAASLGQSNSRIFTFIYIAFHTMHFFWNLPLFPSSYITQVLLIIFFSIDFTLQSFL